MKHIIKTIFPLILSLSVILCGCAGSRMEPYSKSGLYFDTIVSVDIYGSAGDPGEILGECMNICSHYQSLFDKNIPESDIARINSLGAGTLSVDADTASLIDKALSYSDISDGKFDITVNPVSALWDFHEGGETIPSEKDIAEALPFVDHNNIEVDTEKNTVTVKADGVSIDTGGAAKGFIADRIADYLSTCQISGAIINMGGDIKLIGNKPDDSLFNIGIKNPNSPDTCLSSLYVSDKAVATSGTYERAFTKDGRLYHHILDVSTGYPADTDVTSVTVITDSAVDADCLCTVCILLGSKEALELIERTDDTEAIFVLVDGCVIKSSGADAYIKN